MTPPAQQPKCKDCESFRWIPPQPPSGYCEWCIADVCPEGHCGCSPSHFTTRSRPHPAPASPCAKCIRDPMTCGKTKQCDHDAAIARQAREDERKKVDVDLLILRQNIKKKEFKPYMNHDGKAVWYKDVEELIESLRGHK